MKTQLPSLAVSTLVAGLLGTSCGSIVDTSYQGETLFSALAATESPPDAPASELRARIRWFDERVNDCIDEDCPSLLSITTGQELDVEGDFPASFVLSATAPPPATAARAQLPLPSGVSLGRLTLERDGLFGPEIVGFNLDVQVLHAADAQMVADLAAAGVTGDISVGFNLVGTDPALLVCENAVDADVAPCFEACENEGRSCSGCSDARDDGIDACQDGSSFAVLPASTVITLAAGSGEDE
jgi:hypothetical protein